MMKKSIIMVILAGTAFIGGVAAQQAGSVLFPDIVSGDYFADAVNRFTKKGIVTGYQNGRFGPHDFVTRGQVAVILDRYDRNIVAPLRRRIIELQAEAGLAFCGDGTVGDDEQCDDGNYINGDGCSEECLSEVHCPGGLTVGESFGAEDGCNVCTCTEDGIACTSKSCSTREKCFNSSTCLPDEICSVEIGDCRYPCPPGAVCIQACAGACIPRDRDEQCEGGSCEEEKKQNVPVCGNALCEEGEDDRYGIQNNAPTLLQRGSCVQDCEGGLTACEQKKKSLDAVFEQNAACETDADCTVFTRGCSPYRTCAKPVRKDAVTTVTTKVKDYVEECGSREPSLCSACVQAEAACTGGICVIR